ISIDPYMQNLIGQVPGPQLINNSLVGDGLNIGGYRFNQRDNEVRDNLTGKIDYNISTSQAIAATYAWNRYNSDRPDMENDFSAIPKGTNTNRTKLFALSWRWTPSARGTKEARAGFTLAWGYFLTSQNFGSFLVTGMPFSDPVNEFMPQGRTTNTYVISDDAAWEHGRHYVQFGFHGQQ